MHDNASAFATRGGAGFDAGDDGAVAAGGRGVADGGRGADEAGESGGACGSGEGGGVMSDEIKSPPVATGRREENDWLIENVRRLDEKFIERNGEFGFDVCVVRWPKNRTSVLGCIAGALAREDAYRRLRVAP